MKFEFVFLVHVSGVDLELVVETFINNREHLTIMGLVEDNKRPTLLVLVHKTPPGPLLLTPNLTNSRFILFYTVI